ncbi:MAG: hypothetical protein ACXVIH_00275 [Ilumatobacteraceae bacterium]
MDWLIVAAFLIQQGRTDALRRMWIGVGAAVAVCLAVAVVLELVNRFLRAPSQVSADDPSLPTRGLPSALVGHAYAMDV